MIIRSFLLSLLACSTAIGDEFDHVETIKGLRHGDVKEGRRLYGLHCVSCHGKDGKLSLNPLARKFAEDELKFGSDPYSLWKTLSYGNGLMFRWDAVLTPKERYQIVHHIREEIIKPHNEKEYFVPDDEYFEKLPAIARADAKSQEANIQKVEVAQGMIDGTAGQSMVYGPFLQHGVSYTDIKNKNAEYIENTTEKALVVDVPGDAVICYDAARLSVSGIWSGKIADTSNTHHTSYKGGRCLRPDGEVYYNDIDDIGWSVGEPSPPENYDHLTYRGHYLHGDRLLMDYSVASRTVLELPGGTTDGRQISRSLQVGPGEEHLFCLIGRGVKIPKAELDKAGREAGVELVKGQKGGVWASIPPRKEPASFTIWLSPTQEVNIPDGFETPNFEDLKKGGPRRWDHIVQTAVAPGEPVNGYAADILTVPLANPWGAWMRTTAMDFFKDGSIAVSTLSGDVWLVSWPKENPNALSWSRFATGLYEPLGLKIVDDVVYVRGRDRITRLHDLNNDGEADYYESFHEDRNEIGASYHAFVYDLQTDKEGNFYFSQSGYKSPLEGAVVRVTPDGKFDRFIGTDLRNPNGMGAGGPNDWITITDNPSGKAVYNGFTLAKEGVLYGYEHSRTVPMLVVLPAKVDSSSGGQCWSHPENWGPLSGSIIHASYSKCAVFYCFAQVLDPFPNGFAVKLFDLKSAAMRPRVSPTDHQVYMVCQKGWDTNAPYDGIIYRFRHTGDECYLISGAEATADGLRITFACDLDPKSVLVKNITYARESDDKKAPEPKLVPVRETKLVGNNAVELVIPDIAEETLDKRTTLDKKTGEISSVKVNPPYTIVLKLVAKDGTAIEQTIYATINSLPGK